LPSCKPAQLAANFPDQSSNHGPASQKANDGTGRSPRCRPHVPHPQRKTSTEAAIVTESGTQPPQSYFELPPVPKTDKSDQRKSSHHPKPPRDSPNKFAGNPRIGQITKLQKQPSPLQPQINSQPYDLTQARDALTTDPPHLLPHQCRLMARHEKAH